MSSFAGDESAPLPSKDRTSSASQSQPPDLASLDLTSSKANYPLESSSYTLLNAIGRGAFATVYAAVIKDPQIDSKGLDAAQDQSEEQTNNNNTEEPSATTTYQSYPYCSVKVLNLDNVNASLDDIRLEVRTMRSVRHPCILDAYAAFVAGSELWLVTQVMAKGSCLHALGCIRGKGVGEGLDETSIAYVLYGCLRGLEYFHRNGHIHRDVKAGNILLGSLGGVRLADFGVSGWLVSSGDRRKNTKTFVGTPCWMAPEVMEQIDGYDYSADVWSLGITALELAKGFAPYAHLPPMKVLLLTIKEDPPGLETYDDLAAAQGSAVAATKFSSTFKSFVKSCLQKDPKKRPTAAELLNHKLFKDLQKPEKLEEARKFFVATILKHVDPICDKSGSAPNAADDAATRPPGTQPVTFTGEEASKDRPAGTTWVFDDGSQVVRSSAGGEEDNDGKDDFFTEFENSTGGENFDQKRRSVDEDRVLDGEVGSGDVAEGNSAGGENDDFFDEFEKATGGEDFRRTKEDEDS